MIALVSMNQTAFERFLTRIIPEYAEEKVAAGNWTQAESFERSRAEFARLLPDGLNSKDHYLYSILRDDEDVGVLWLAAMGPQNMGFIYELYVNAEARGQGVASAAMRALEIEARRLGFASLGLHVFGHNHVARHLYEKLGYEITNINMQKPLED